MRQKGEQKGAFSTTVNPNVDISPKFRRPMILRKFSLKGGTKEAYQQTLRIMVENSFKNGVDQRKRLSDKIEEEHQRLKNARNLLLIGDIDGADYKEIKTISNETIVELEKHLTLNEPKTDIHVIYIVNQRVNRLSKLDELFLNASTAQKKC